MAGGFVGAKFWRGHVISVKCVFVVAILTCVVTALPASASTPVWRLQSTPNPSGAEVSALSGVVCPSAALCSAVGYSVNGSGVYDTLADRSKGSTWEVQSTPNPSGATLSLLSGIACPSTTLCIAVGSYVDSSGVDFTLTERWNGSTWEVQSTPNPSGATGSQLNGVACPSTTQCTAVGYYFNSSGACVALAEGWNGSTWEVQSTPAASAGTCSVFTGVACASTRLCTAVGYDSNSSGGAATLVEGWNGSTWQVQSTPSPNAAPTNLNVLNGVACASATLCIAVGYGEDSSLDITTLTERWDGTTWVLESTPNPGGVRGSGLSGIACPSTTLCTAVGNYANSALVTVTLVERWNGNTWVVESTPNPSGAQGSGLSGITCPLTTLCTAVGDYVNSSSTDVTLAERYP